MGKLTPRSVKTAGPGRHVDGEGLHLVVKPSGSRSWVLRVMHNRREREIGLGSIAALSLPEARVEAAKYRKLAKQGIDPVEARRKSKATVPTFAQAATDAHTDLSGEWTDKTAAQFMACMQRHAVPALGRRLVSEITTDAIVSALRPIWREKPEMARKTRQHILRVLRHAKAHGHYPGALPEVAIISDGLGKRPAGGHFAAMPYGEVPDFVAAQLAEQDTPARLGLLFAILTAARSGEVRAAEWRQIDREARTWSRPAALMKSGAPHVITLNRAALAVLDRAEALSNGSRYVFASLRTGKPLSDAALSKMLRDSGRSETVHGFRSTFRDWAAEQMPHIPWNVAEMALAHATGTAVERAYARSDLLALRFDLSDAWGAFAAPELGRSDD